MSFSDGDPLAGAPQKPRFTPPAPDTSGYGSGPVPPGVSSPKPPFQLGQYRLAEWGPRFGAWIIDLLIVSAIFFVIALPLIIFAGLFGDSTGGIIGTVLASLLGVGVFFVASLLYAPFFMTKWNGQTVGKRVVGIRVIRTDGQPMDFGAAFVRESLVKGLLVGLVGAFTVWIAPLINYLWPLWDAEKRALHDFLCGTRVVEA